MQREIKFRAKRKDNGCWVYGDLLTKPVHHECAILEHGVINYSVDPETVGQYTGITDKDEVDIYEDDIIKISGRVLRVIFDNGSFLTPWNTSRYRLGGWGREAVSKIGNIHDNPELLIPPADSPALNTMTTDPNVKQPDELKGDEAADLKAAPAEQATEDKEEGTTEG